MAKAKNMTAADMRLAMDKVEIARGVIDQMDEAVRSLRIDDIPEVRRYTRDLVGLARDANQLAMRLFTLSDIQERQTQIEAMENVTPAKAGKDAR